MTQPPTDLGFGSAGGHVSTADQLRTTMIILDQQQGVSARRGVLLSAQIDLGVARLPE